MWTFPWHCLDIHVVREIAVLVLGKWIFGSGFAQQSTTSGPPWRYSLLLTQQSWNQVFTIASVRATVLKAFACMLAMEWKVLKKEGPGMYEQWFTGETKLQNAFEKVPYSADHFIWTTCVVSDLQ